VTDHTLYDSQDHTPGRVPPIPESPFRTAESIARRLSADGGLWYIELQVWVGGLGYVDQAAETSTRETRMLYRDASGGWWLQRRIGKMGWLPDVDRTLALVWPGQREVDELCQYSAVNEDADNAADMRHPMW